MWLKDGVAVVRVPGSVTAWHWRDAAVPAKCPGVDENSFECMARGAAHGLG